ncbi:Acid ceramidase 2 [Colletotrichum chlorophyti]|uniref:ceramidase n=1 Tax=Colletotrichum chlorophyti TaxID=708187 RepID=A0A1Q8S463_9PEZI|nr:Acid ceramidase 2 [Colletotrichum chlorophyti]
MASSPGPADPAAPASDIPVYRVDLAEPPKQRYARIARDFAERIRKLSPLFDEVVESLFDRKLATIVKFTSRFALRRVFDREQTKEIKSIARIARIRTHHAIALNVFLDLMLGCTSGAALVRSRSTDQTGWAAVAAEDRLVHFRTLEWGMDILRDLLVVIEFVDTRRADPQKVVATSVTYAGFVGTLTGVRAGLSLSLNFRPHCDCKASSLLKHQLMVVLGFRESIPSVLRRILLDSDSGSSGSTGRKAPSSSEADQFEDDETAREPLSVKERAEQLVSVLSSPCYLTLCDGNQVAIIQKDLFDGKIKTSDEFMIQCNHDVDHEKCCSRPAVRKEADPAQAKVLGDEVWLEESEERQQALLDKWIKHARATTSDAAARWRARQNGICVNGLVPLVPETDKLRGVSEAQLRDWVAASPTTNEATHFSCLMDPRTGKVTWLERGPTPTESEPDV